MQHNYTLQLLYKLSTQPQMKAHMYYISHLRLSHSYAILVPVNFPSAVTSLTGTAQVGLCLDALGNLWMS